MQRLQLIRLCKTKEIDYKQVAKDVPALVALLVASDKQASGGDEQTGGKASPRSADTQAGSAGSAGESVVETDVGKRCHVDDGKVWGNGTVRFYGPHARLKKLRIGVEMDKYVARCHAHKQSHKQMRFFAVAPPWVRSPISTPFDVRHVLWGLGRLGRFENR
jgi:hypothetical protein